MPKLIDRFRGANGRRLIIDALRKQQMFRVTTAGQEILGVAQLEEYPLGSILMEQGGGDNDILFILAGRTSISVNRHAVAERKAGQHVGEMALIDPSATRSATVTALEETICARVVEANFTPIANRHPKIWRRLAIELADRLRQRNFLIRTPNPSPHIFIGSSSEALEIAREISSQLLTPPFSVRLWSEDVFTPSNTNIESLETELARSDFAVLVLAPDDHVISRGKGHDAPRDNVVFELGLFMGALTRARTYLVNPIDHDTKIPTDLLGVITIRYSSDSSKPITERLTPVCAEIRKLVIAKGPR